MKLKVLVSGAGGDVGQGVLKSLRSSALDIALYTTCTQKHSSWLHQPGINGFIAPLSASPEYVPYLVRLIRQQGIQVFIPTVDGEIGLIARERDYLERRTGVKVLVDGPEKVAVCDDKFRTFEFLRDHGFPCPQTLSADDPAAWSMAERLGYPLMVKKRCGRASQEVFRVDNPEWLGRFIGDSSFIIQEWLDPAQGEYTSGIYLGDDGEIKGCCTFRRKLKGGSTFIAERVVDPELEAPLKSMALTLGMKYVNIQSMRRDKSLVPFEFNGRLSGTTAMVTRVFNAPELFIRERLLGEPLAAVRNDELFVAMRYYEEVYASPRQIDELLSRSEQV